MAENDDDNDKTDAALDLGLARTVLRQGELMLEAQLRLQLAADQRATAVAALFVVLATGVTTFGATRLGTDGGLAVGIGSVAAGACFVVAAGLAAWAARPGTFAVAGSAPDSWWSDGVEERSLAACLRKQSVHYDGRIARNRKSMEGLARWLLYSTRVGALALVVGLVSWGLTSWWA